MPLDPQAIGYTGANIAFSAGPALDSIGTGDRRFLWVKNASGVSTTVTIVIQGTTFEQANPDVVVSVNAGTERMFGPFPADLGGGTGSLLFGVSPTTSVTVAAVDVPIPPADLP